MKDFFRIKEIRFIPKHVNGVSGLRTIVYDFNNVYRFGYTEEREKFWIDVWNDETEDITYFSFDVRKYKIEIIYEG